VPAGHASALNEPYWYPFGDAAAVVVAVASASTAPHTQMLGPWNAPLLCCTVLHFGLASRSVFASGRSHPDTPVRSPFKEPQPPELHPMPK